MEVPLSISYLNLVYWIYESFDATALAQSCNTRTFSFLIADDCDVASDDNENSLNQLVWELHFADHWSRRLPPSPPNRMSILFNLIKTNQKCKWFFNWTHTRDDDDDDVCHCRHYIVMNVVYSIHSLWIAFCDVCAAVVVDKFVLLCVRALSKWMITGSLVFSGQSTARIEWTNSHTNHGTSQKLIESLICSSARGRGGERRFENA